LASRHETLTQRVLLAEKQEEEAKRELQNIDAAINRLPAVQESDGLAGAMKLARSLGDIDRQIEEVSRDIAMEKKSYQAQLARTRLWSGALDQLLELALPLQETVRRFETDFNKLDRERQQLNRDLKETDTELKTARKDWLEVEYGGEVPTEGDLHESRRKRQQGWQLLRRQWIEGVDIAQEAEEYAPGQPLHEAYEKDVARADLVGDRLRREAERVAKAASLRARIETLEEAILHLRQQETAVTGREKDLDAAWQSAWVHAGITPLSPREMLAWLADIDTLRSQVTMMLRRKNELDERVAARHDCRRTLLAELLALGKEDEFPGPKIEPLLIHAESIIEDISRRRGKLEKLHDQKTQNRAVLFKAGKELQAAKEERNEWQKTWARTLAALGLPDQVLPGEALDLLETIGSCLTKLEKASEFQSRINGIDRDVTLFSADVLALLEQTAPDLKNVSPDQAVVKLHAMLGKARQDNELLKKNQEETETLATEIASAEKTLQSLDIQMAALLKTAHCNGTADVAGAMRKSAEYQRLSEKVEDAETTLARVSEGIAIEELKRQADAVNVDELPGQITSLKRRINEELNPQITEILKQIGEESRELQLMDGSAGAAEAAEEMEQVAAGIRRQADRYIRLKLAARILRDEIERYREEHQDPILQLASRYFSTLTIGSFAGLRTDVDDSGNPVLVGMRPDDARLTVAAMSSGTRDQLYLALRLATLEWRLQNGEPMPLIVDDILVNFDDDRSNATLKALADLAEENQVILFTHHRRIVDQALQLKESRPVSIHEL
jgi:uncharacterized protein YhaN